MTPCYIHWNVNPEIVNIFGISLQYYGILFVGGLFLAALILKKMFKGNNIPAENVERLSIYAIIGIFVGARIGHCLFYDFDYFSHHLWEIILPIAKKPGGGIEFIGYRGLASHGGAIGLIVALLLYCRKSKQPFVQTLDFLAVVTPVSACCIRLGNLMNSEIIGMPTTVSWAFIFEQVDNVPRHPAQLYEALAYLVIFGIMWTMYRKIDIKKYRGLFFGTVLTLIFTFRFFIEFLKERQVDFEESMVLDMGQILSIPFVLLGIGCVVFSLWKYKKKNVTAK